MKEEHHMCRPRLSFRHTVTCHNLLQRLPNSHENQYWFLYKMLWNKCEFSYYRLSDRHIWRRGVNESSQVKGKVTPLQARLWSRGGGGKVIALLFQDLGARKGWAVSSTLRPLFTPGKDPVPIVQKAGWASGSVWTGGKSRPLTGIRSPDRPARSQSESSQVLCIFLEQFTWNSAQVFSV